MTLDRPVTKWALLAAMVGAPAVFVPQLGDIFGLPKLAWVAACVAVAVVAFVVEQPDGGRPAMPRPSVTPYLAAFVGTQALATLTSIDRSTSLLGAYERYGGLLPLLLHLGLAALVLAAWWRDPGDTWRLAAAIVGGGVVVATYVLVQIAGLDPIDWVEKSGAVVQYQAGSMGNGDFAAAYLGCALPLTLVLARGTRRLPRPIVVAVAIELAVALVATKGRGGLLAVAVGAIVALVLVRPWQGSTTWTGRRLAIGAAGAAAVGIVLAVVAVTATDVLRTQSVEVRRREWAGAIAIFRDRPITGTGPDTYVLRYPAHRTVTDARELGLQIADKPHDLLLEYASATGVLGLVAFVVLVVVVGRNAVRHLRSRASPEEHLLPAAFAATAAGYLAQALFSFDVPGLVGVWWVALAVLVLHTDPVLVSARAARAKPRRGRARQASPAGVAAAALVALLLVVLTGRAVVADRAAGRALATDGESALTHGERALRLNTAQPAYALSAGAAGERAGATTEDDTARPALFRRAVAAYRHGLADQPDNVLLRAGLARTLTLVGRSVDRGAFVEAQREWQEAIRLDPNDWELHEGYGLMLNHWANATGGAAHQRAASARELQRALEIRPTEAATWSTLALVLESLDRRDEAAHAAAEGARLAPDDAQARDLADRLATP